MGPKKSKKPQQFTAYEVGQVKAHMYHGLGPEAICGIITKADGKSHFSHTAVSRIIAKLKSSPSWRGDRQVGSGAARKTTAAEDRALVKGVLDNRGKRKVTGSSLQRTSPVARKLGRTAVEERLFDAGLASEGFQENNSFHICRARSKCVIVVGNPPD